MRVLVVNAGSSSLKLSLVEDGRTETSSTVERWDGQEDTAGLGSFVEECGRVDAVGHRVVHGGPDHPGPARVDASLIERVESLRDLAPLHNPRAVAGMRAVGAVLDAPEVACFDTSFHAAMPLAARTYALPREWNERWSLRRYGFHGLSHAHASRRAAEVVGSPLEDLRVVSCHLGSGASVTAVVGGRSVDTSMGFTPLEGLVMGTRSGTVDPGLLLWLLDQDGIDADRLGTVLDQESGLLGLSGVSGDLRDVLAARGSDPRAALAYDVFVHRLRREVGAMAASAGGLDVLVLTGGIGEHSAQLRADLADGLRFLGVDVDEDANASATPDVDISAASATARTVVTAAAEDLEIARQVHDLLAGPRDG